MLDVDIPLLFILSIMLSIVSVRLCQQSTNTEWQSHHFLIVFYHIFPSEEKTLFVVIQGIPCLFSYTVDNPPEFGASHTLSHFVREVCFTECWCGEGEGGRETDWRWWTETEEMVTHATTLHYH